MKAHEFQSPDGLTVFIEAAPENVEVVRRELGKRGELFDTASKLVNQLEEVGKGIGSFCRTIFVSARDQMGKEQPERMEISFGVKLAAEGAIWVFAKASAECTLQVKASWSKRHV